jgi:hypothetical protein
LFRLSVASYVVTADNNYSRYYDMQNGEYFILQWMKITMEVDIVLVMKSNAYLFRDYHTMKLPNEVAMIGYNSSNYDLNFFLNISTVVFI